MWAQRFPVLLTVTGIAKGRIRLPTPCTKRKPGHRLTTAIVLLGLLCSLLLHGSAFAAANPNLTFTMSGPASATAFKKIEYVLTLTNVSNAAYDADVYATMDLPQGTSFDPSGNGRSSFGCAVQGTTVRCQPYFLAHLNAGESVLIYIDVIADGSNRCAALRSTSTLWFVANAFDAVTSAPIVTTLDGCDASFTVTPSASANGSINPSSPQMVAAGDQATFTVTPDAGYDASVSGCSGRLVGNAYTTAPITQNCTVSAQFVSRQYAITPSAGPHTIISPSVPVNASAVGETKFTLTADPGYTVFVDSDCIASYKDTRSGQTLVRAFSNLSKSCLVNAHAVPNLAVTVVPDPAVYGSPISIIASLTDASPPGSVSMSIPPNPFNGPAPFNCSNIPVVNHTATCAIAADQLAQLGQIGFVIEASYNETGSLCSCDRFSTTAHINFSMIYPSTLSITAPTPIVVGNRTLVAAQITVQTPSGTSVAPTGTVTIRDETDSITCSYALSSTQPGCWLTPPSSGNKTLTAEYAGDSNFARSVSPRQNLNVAKFNASMTMASSANPALVGQTVTLSAKLTGFAPRGTVTFTDNGTPLCDSPSLASTANGATASCNASFQSTGNHVVAVNYVGDANNTSASAVLAQSIVSSTTPTQTTLSSSWNPATQGHAVTLAATVTGNSPGGNVDFVDASTRAVVCANVPLIDRNDLSKAFCRLSTEDSAFSRSFVAMYRGNGTNAPSESEVLTEKYTTALNLNPNQAGFTGSWYNPATAGQGLLMQVFPNQLGDGKGQLFAGWFTYAGGQTGSATWYTLQGEVNDNGNTSLSIFQGSGGLFDTAVSIGIKLVGTATLKFADCTHATLSYKFEDGSARSGQMPLQRLTQDSTCNNPVAGAATAGDALLSGAWYNPGTSGQGLIFDIAPGQNLVFGAWYTYSKLTPAADDAAGGRRWYTIQSNAYIAGTREAHNIPVYATWGGAFDDSTPINSQQVGIVDIHFDSCSSMSLSYRFTAGENNGLNGTIPLKPVGPMPQECH